MLSRKPEAISVRPAGGGAGRGGPGAGEGRGGGPDAAPPPRQAAASASAPTAPAGARRHPPPAPAAAPAGGRWKARTARTSRVGHSRRQLHPHRRRRLGQRGQHLRGRRRQQDGIGNARVAKFDKDGHFIKSWGARGSEPGQFNALRGIAIDAQGNVYVADAGNKRIQVFDGDGNAKRQIAGIGVPTAICITPGAHQYIYSSNSNDPETLDNGEIYKLELDGKIVGKFGTGRTDR